MFIDGRETSDIPNTDYDIIIIGAGPAGITLANELKDTSLRIALLESGGEEYDEDAQDLNEGRIEGNSDEFDLVTSRLRLFGGTSEHWGGHCTPLDPIDFTRSPSTGLTGWPFGKEVLDPFYERAHRYCDLGSYDYDFSSLAPQDSSYRLLADNPEVETAVLRQSTPTRFGPKYRDALTGADNVHVWLWTNVQRVTTNRDSGEVPSELVDTQTLTGMKRQFSARAVVLAAGAIEATRLLMYSNALNGTSVGNTGDLLGRCYMDHPSGGAAFIHFSKRSPDKIYWTGIDTHADNGTPLHFVMRLTDAALEARNLPNFQYFVFPFADDSAAEGHRREAKRGLFSLKQIGKWAVGRDTGGKVELGKEYCNFIMSSDAIVTETARQIFSESTYSRALLKYEAEERPDRVNRITLDDHEKDALGMPRPVLTWKPSEDDLSAIRQTAELFGTFVGAAGIGRVQLEDHDEDSFWGASTAWHQLGTMRMSESMTSGVVDPDCRVYGAGQLYVASGAVFPTAGRANPTLTIVALTIRLADHLKAEFEV